MRKSANRTEYPKSVKTPYSVKDAKREIAPFRVRVAGKLMMPKYPDGCIVTLEPRLPWLSPKFVHGGDFLIRLADGQETFKRVFLFSDDSRRVLLANRNPVSKNDSGRVVAIADILYAARAVSVETPVPKTPTPKKMTLARAKAAHTVEHH